MHLCAGLGCGLCWEAGWSGGAVGWKCVEWLMGDSWLGAGVGAGVLEEVKAVV